MNGGQVGVSTVPLDQHDPGQLVGGQHLDRAGRLDQEAADPGRDAVIGITPV
jgi:hypothetical protein